MIDVLYCVLSVYNSKSNALITVNANANSRFKNLLNQLCLNYEHYAAENKTPLVSDLTLPTPGSPMYHI